MTRMDGSSPLRLQDLSGQNRGQVIGWFRRRETLTRQELARLTGLSWGGMTKIVGRLLEEGLLVETTSQAAGPGRKPHSLSLCRDDFLVAGLDVNLEGLRGVVVNLSGEVLAARSRPNDAQDAPGLRALILDFARQVLSDFPGRRFVALGVAMQGIVDAAAGRSIAFPRFPDWREVPLADLLSEATGLSVRVEHDPDCLLTSVLGESPAENALLLRVDRSIGMAVAMNGHLLRGPGVLEIAHTVADPEGPPCPCGQRGCLDVFTLPCLVNGEYRPEAVERLLPHLSAAILNSARLFAPAHIYLTGKLMRHYDRFGEALHDRLRALSPLRDVPVSCLDEDTRVERGAAALAVERLLREGRL